MIRMIIFGGFPKLGVPILGVPIIRSIIFWSLYWGPLILGNYQLGVEAGSPPLSGNIQVEIGVVVKELTAVTIICVYGK